MERQHTSNSALTLLLADDSATFTATMRRVLDRLDGVEVIGTAKDGRHTLAQIKALKPNLVLLDIAMPHLNGLQVAQQLANTNNAPQIIFLTMNDTDAYRTAANKLGALAFVSKSNFVDEIVPMVQQIARDKVLACARCNHESITCNDQACGLRNI